MNLIATRRPYNFSRENFAEFITKIKKIYPDGFEGLSDKYAKESIEYQLKYTEWENKCEIQKNKKSENKKMKGKFDGEGGRISSSDNFDLPPEPIKPRFEFAPKFQINTINHWRNIHQINIKPKYQFRSAILFTDDFVKELCDCRVDDDLLLLLCSGVGVVDRESIKCKNYQTLVAKLATNNKLTYLITDSSICYGTNYPISRVFVTDDFSDAHSSNTLFQLLGRSGRVGKSWKAEGYISDKIAKKLQNFIHNPDDKSALIEANNMDSAFIRIIEEKETKDRKEYLEAKQRDAIKRERERKQREELEATINKSKATFEEKKSSSTTSFSITSLQKSSPLQSDKADNNAAQPIYNFSRDRFEEAKAKRIADLKRKEEEEAKNNKLNALGYPADRRPVSSPVEVINTLPTSSVYATPIPEKKEIPFPPRPIITQLDSPATSPPITATYTPPSSRNTTTTPTPTPTFNRAALAEARKKKEENNLSWRRN
jgi:hypothetical protein